MGKISSSSSSSALDVLVSDIGVSLDAAVTVGYFGLDWSHRVKALLI